MLRKMSVLLSLFLGIMPAVGMAGLIRHDRDVASYRQLGNEPQFASVGEHLLTPGFWREASRLRAARRCPGINPLAARWP